MESCDVLCSQIALDPRRHSTSWPNLLDTAAWVETLDVALRPSFIGVVDMPGAARSRQVL